MANPGGGAGGPPLHLVFRPKRGPYFRTKYLVCRTRISLDGGGTLKSWVAHVSCTGDWSSQLTGSEIPDEATLALTFNEFLGSLTAHFRPLEPLSPVFGRVPAHLYISERTVYKTLRALKVKKSPGPELIPNIVWKEFAFELAPVRSCSGGHIQLLA